MNTTALKKLFSLQSKMSKNTSIQILCNQGIKALLHTLSESLFSRKFLYHLWAISVVIGLVLTPTSAMEEKEQKYEQQEPKVRMETLLSFHGINIKY